MTEYSIIGKRFPRHDALQQVTGKVTYGEDLYREKMLYAKALYSEYSHAEIIAIDTTVAEKLPGVKGIITARDVAVNRFGPTHKDEPVLADDKVRFKGDALAVVAAESLKIAREALKLIKVDYRPLPAVLDVREAIKAGVPAVHGNTNIAEHIKIKRGDVEKAFSQADLIVEEEFSTQKVEHCPIEPHVALAYVENDGKLVIWTANSRVYDIATFLTEILQVPMNRMQVKAPMIGGGFGGKNEVSLEPWVALLAMKTRRPVKMVFTREEEFFRSTVRHPYLMKYKTGLKNDGSILARQIEIISDSGAYVGIGAGTLTKAAIHSAGPYNIPNIKIDAYLVYTNNAVGGAMRGFGVPQVTFAHEVHTNSIAEKLGIDPIEFRYKNLYKETGITPPGQVVNSKSLRMTLDKALELSTRGNKQEAISNEKAR